MSTEHSKDAEDIDVAYVAHLARLALTEEETATFQAQLHDILGHVRQLSELDVEGIEPMAHVVPVENVLRADEVKDSLPREEAMGNAPDQRGGQFLVPRIIE